MSTSEIVSLYESAAYGHILGCSLSILSTTYPLSSIARHQPLVAVGYVCNVTDVLLDTLCNIKYNFYEIRVTVSIK